MLPMHSITSVAINCTFAIGLAIFFSESLGGQAGIADRINTVTLLSFTLIAAYWDLMTHRIPNRLTYGCVSLAVAIQVAVLIAPGLGKLSVSLTESLVAGFLCGGLTLYFWSRGAIGGGDVKLACGIGLLMGPIHAIWAILLTHLIAALFSVLWIVTRTIRLSLLSSWQIQSTSPNSLIAESAITGATRLPMAGFYALGVVLTLVFAR